MKRIVTAVVLLIICVGICTVSSIISENTATHLIEILDLLEQELKSDNYEESLKHISKLEKEWENGEKIFSSISETKLIDELDLSFNSLEKYIEARQIGQAIIIIEECRNGLETVYLWQKIAIENIL